MKSNTLASQLHGAITNRVSVNNRKEIEEFIKVYQQDILAARL